MASLRNTSNKETSGTGCFLTFVPLFLTVIGLSLGLVLYFVLSDVETPVQAGMPRVMVGSGSDQLAAFYAPPVLRWSTALENWSSQYWLDVNLVATVMQIESCGDPEAMSIAGAAGLFQVMPFHFSPGEDSMDPGTNARRGLGYLKLSIKPWPAITGGSACSSGMNRSGPPIPGGMPIGVTAFISKPPAAPIKAPPCRIG